MNMGICKHIFIKVKLFHIMLQMMNVSLAKISLSEENFMFIDELACRCLQVKSLATTIMLIAIALQSQKHISPIVMK